MANNNTLRPFATATRPLSLTYGITEQQLCNVKATILHLVSKGVSTRHAVTDAILAEAGCEPMAKPSPRQMAELIAFAKSPTTQMTQR